MIHNMCPGRVDSIISNLKNAPQRLNYGRKKVWEATPLGLPPGAFWMALAHNLETSCYTPRHHSQVAANGTQNPNRPAQPRNPSHPCNSITRQKQRCRRETPTPEIHVKGKKSIPWAVTSRFPCLTRNPVKWPSHPSSSSDQSPGVILDSFLLFGIQRVSKCCWLYLQNVSRIQALLTTSTTFTLVQTTIIPPPRIPARASSWILLHPHPHGQISTQWPE